MRRKRTADANGAGWSSGFVGRLEVRADRSGRRNWPYKDRKAVAAALKEVYRCKDAEAAAVALEAFAETAWGQKYPAIAMTWRRHWSEVVPFFAFHDDIRRIVYTTNAIEALNAKLRRAVRTRGHFPSDEAAMKLLFLVLHLTERDWKMPPKEWGMARAQFAILFEDRFPAA